MQSRAYEVSANQSEQLRVQELEHYLTVIEEGESELHSLVNLLAKLCKTPFGGVSVVDNNTVWIKAHYGIEASCLPREGAFCAAAVDCNQDIFYVENTLKDSRFINNPLVQSAPQIRFYAAAPIFSSTGFAIGTLWIMDTKPLQISDEIIVILRSLSTYLTHILYSQYRCEVTQLPNRLGFIRRLQAQINLNPDQKVFVGTAHIQKMKYLSIIYDNEVKNSLILAMSQRLRSFPNWTLLSHIGEGNFAFA
ncbi:GAF domain-containing protein [Vibrio mimicus]